MTQSTSLFNELPIRIFFSVTTICLFWMFFISDYSFFEIQSPIKFSSPALSSVSLDSDSQPNTLKSDISEPVSSEPAPSVNLPPADVKSYIEKYSAVAIEEMHRTGIPASVSMAQALIESKAGRSALALTANNHFGIKCHVKGKCRSGHCINFTDDVEIDYFIVYQNSHKSWKAHSEFLKKPRYKPCFEQTTYDGWCRQLKKCGYATDKRYAEKLIQTIKKHKLYLLDNL